ncbi:MAG: DNA polymerase III subunit alpha [Solitalea-like symbiont of Tyrophagus putrescentiae]
MKFSHLHVHTQFSLLDGAAMIDKLLLKAKNDGMPAVAITDHGNMFGVFHFVKEANKHNIKPIIGCEFYLVEDRSKKQFTKEEQDHRFHQLLLAKNKQGYQNLIKLCSLGYIDGLYSKYPRIDKELIEKYHGDLIATTCCLAAKIPRLIQDDKYEDAEKELKWWLNIFQEDFYIELQRHNLAEDDKVNAKLLEFAKKYNIKIIATNDSHYVDKSDANFHDILLCINTGNVQSTPLNTKKEHKKGYRFGFAKSDGSVNDVFYFKTQAEMSTLFHDIPDAIENTNEIVDKIDNFQLTRDILLPNFKIEEPFKDQNAYLRYLTEEGAKKRYGNIDTTIKERIELELEVIEKMDFAGYFLIVADFIDMAREAGVVVGPGRGSAAGSLIAYCLRITDIDPIKYNLLFERFLNPDRKSMPDIDIDFNDEGREEVIKKVVEKYTEQQVAQIITYGTIAAKTSIKDAARVLELPLNEANNLTKLVPDNPGTRLNKIINLHKQNKLKEAGFTQDQLKDINHLVDYYNYQPSSKELEEISNLKSQIKKLDTKIKNIEEMEGAHSPNIKQIVTTKSAYEKNLKNLEIPKIRAEVLKEATNIEGMIRNVGIHAAGIIIAPVNLTDIIPVMKMKDSNMYVSQYEGGIIEEAGVIKMDFLGLKTLSIIKKTTEVIKETHNISIDIEDIPLDDKKTYELYQRGETNGTFQFESAGMQKYLKELVPDRFEDLVALNALYRPGPMEYIDNYIRRKHGQEEVKYDLPEMEEYLSDTYGITVYQEQVMLLAQKLSGLSRGDADLLRKAMGKKDKNTLDKLKSKFIDGAVAKGYNIEILQKIWLDWEAFAAYAFNKSHSVCYAILAYRTAYLKAHYPAEYMASVLTCTRGNLSKITFFIEECKRMQIKVLGPDVNLSSESFSAYNSKEIRFGLEGIKGLGEVWVNKIIDYRDGNENNNYEKRPFVSFQDFIMRVNPNKSTLEALALSGAFDSFSFNKVLEISGAERVETIAGKRSLYTQKGQDDENYIEKIVAYLAKKNKESKKIKPKKTGQKSLLEGQYSSEHSSRDYDEKDNFPIPIDYPEFIQEDKFAKEKEYLGIYISGHPLDAYQEEIKNFCNAKVADIEIPVANKTLIIAGVISDLQTKTSKAGRAYISFTLDDEVSSIKMVLFGADYAKYKDKIQDNSSVFIKGEFSAGYRQKGSIEFKITEVGLLAEIFQYMSSGIVINANIDDIDGINTAKLLKILNTEKYAGDKQLFVKIFDEDIQANLYSDKYKVKIDQEFLKSLSDASILFTIKK